MSGLGHVISNLYGDIDRNITIWCPLRYMFKLVCILKLEGLLLGYVKWKNTKTGNVNFMTQNVGSETSLLDKNVEIDRKITFLCPFRYIFKLVCILKLEGLLLGYFKWKNTKTGNVNFMTQNVGSETSLLD